MIARVMRSLALASLVTLAGCFGTDLNGTKTCVTSDDCRQAAQTLFDDASDPAFEPVCCAGQCVLPAGGCDNGFRYLTNDQAYGACVASPPVCTNSGVVVTSVTSPDADGTYTTGDVLTIQVIFSKPVYTLGSTLTLATGSVEEIATATDSGSPDVLAFQYTVRAGDASPDLDVASQMALSGELNGDPVLPLPGAPGSLSANKNLVIATTP